MERHTWIMPDERDAKFSMALIDKISNFAKSFGINSFDLEIKEKYTDESVPHYHCHVSSNGLLGRPATELSVTYTATVAGEDQKKEVHEGEMTLIFKATGSTASKDLYVTAGALYIYDECIREYYPEWETRYNNPLPPHRD